MKITNDKQLKEKLGTENPFTVPEGYFEQFTQQLMDNLPEPEIDDAETEHIGVWQKIRPWFYLAAMFCGIALGLRYMLSISDTPSDTFDTMTTVDTNVENNYYDEYLEDIVLHTTLDDYSVYCCLNSEENS